MKICLVRPSFVTTMSAVGVEIILPLGVTYLASHLRCQGFDVAFVDAVGEGIHAVTPIDDIPEGLLRGLPDEETVKLIPPDVDVIGVSCMFSVNWVVNRRLLQAIRRAFPDKVLMIGGEHATAMPEYCLRDAGVIDFVVLGEGESTTADLLWSLDRGDEPTAVPGVGFLKDGAYRVSPPRQRERDVDRIPWPAWDMLPVETYLGNTVSAALDCGRSMPIIASRGCPYDCTFCSNGVMWGRLWRARTAEDVVAEIEHNYKSYRIDHVDFFDLTMITKRSWIVEFCERMIERKLGVSWQIICTRSEAIDAEVTQLLKRAGCNFITYAPESGSEQVLKDIRKKVNIEAMLASIQAAYRAGLGVKLNFVLAFPDDRFVDVLASYWMAARAAWRGAHDASFFTFSPYPGSDLFHRLVDEGIIRVNDAYFFDLALYNFKRMKSFARRFSDGQVRYLCLGGMAIFYLVSFARRPVRILHLIKDLAQSQGRTKLSATLVRIMRNRRTLKQGSDSLEPAVLGSRRPA